MGKRMKPPYWIPWMLAGLSVVLYLTDHFGLLCLTSLVSAYCIKGSIDCIEEITHGR